MADTSSTLWSIIINSLIKNLQEPLKKYGPKGQATLGTIKDYLLQNQSPIVLDKVCKILREGGFAEEFIKNTFKEAYEFFELDDDLKLEEIGIAWTEQSNG